MKQLPRGLRVSNPNCRYLPSPAGPHGRAAVDEFFITVVPLPPDEDIIHLGAIVGTSLPEPVFETDVTHDITAVPGLGDHAGTLPAEPTTWGAIKATYHQCCATREG
jgi:hypothetical protein